VDCAKVENENQRFFLFTHQPILCPKQTILWGPGGHRDLVEGSLRPNQRRTGRTHTNKIIFKLVLILSQDASAIFPIQKILFRWNKDFMTIYHRVHDLSQTTAANILMGNLLDAML
jgi:hypothetical protein